MKDSNKILIGLGLGLIAAGAAGYFLTTDEGKKFEKRTKKQLKKLEKELTASIKNNANLITEKVATASETAKAWSSEASEMIQNKIASSADVAEDAVEEVQEDFESGADKARRNIAAKAEYLNEVIEQKAT